jgi:hypothetical protein
MKMIASFIICLQKKVMSNVFLKEERVKVQMINEIIKHSDHSYSKKELEAKNFSVLKFMYYDAISPVVKAYKMAS